MRDHLDLSVLDALRGLAATYVVLFHSSQYLWAYSADAVPVSPGLVNSLSRTWMALMGYGHVAVLLFFLISGFCIHYRQARQAAASHPEADRTFDLRNFAWRRVRRLYPVLLLALGVTAAFDKLGATLSPSLYAGTGTPVELTVQLAAGSTSIGALMANLLFQGGLSAPIFGSNVPLWSLAYEFWFYALYPVMLVVSRRAGTLPMLALAAAVSVAASVVSRYGVTPVPWWLADVLAHWVTWIAGAVIAEMCVRRRHVFRARWLLLGGGLLVGGFMVAQPGEGGNISDLGWGVALAGLLAGTMLISPFGALGRGLEAMAIRLVPLGAISYSMYALHFPLIVLLLACWQSTHTAAPNDPELMLAGAVSSIAFAAGAWYLIERPAGAQQTRHSADSQLSQPLNCFSMLFGRLRHHPTRITPIHTGTSPTHTS